MGVSQVQWCHIRSSHFKFKNIDYIKCQMQSIFQYYSLNFWMSLEYVHEKSTHIPPFCFCLGTYAFNVTFKTEGGSFGVY